MEVEKRERASSFLKEERTFLFKYNFMVIVVPKSNRDHT